MSLVYCMPMNVSFTHWLVEGKQSLLTLKDFAPKILYIKWVSQDQVNRNYRGLIKTTVNFGAEGKVAIGIYFSVFVFLCRPAYKQRGTTFSFFYFDQAGYLISYLWGI